MGTSTDGDDDTSVNVTGSDVVDAVDNVIDEVEDGDATAVDVVDAAIDGLFGSDDDGTDGDQDGTIEDG